MRLEQTFLTALDHQDSAEAVKQALDACGEELRAACGPLERAEEIETVFFRDGCDPEAPTEALQELIRLAVLYERYDGLLEEREKEENWILNIMYEALGLYASHRRERFLQTAPEDQIRCCRELYREARGIRNSRRILFLEPDGARTCVRYSLPFTENWKEEGSFGYDMVTSLLISAVQKPWDVAVIAGSGGLTPRRLYDLVLGDRGWSVCQRDWPREEKVFDNVLRKRTLYAIKE